MSIRATWQTVVDGQVVAVAVEVLRLIDRSTVIVRDVDAGTLSFADIRDLRDVELGT